MLGSNSREENLTSWMKSVGKSKLSPAIGYPEHRDLL